MIKNVRKKSWNFFLTREMNLLIFINLYFIDTLKKGPRKNGPLEKNPRKKVSE